MTSDHKKPGVAFWATVTLVVMLVAYPLSIGPVFWTCNQLSAPDWLWSTVDYAYGPLWFIAFYGPEPVFQWLIEYCMMGSPPVACVLDAA
jgi:hypothetical protein